MRISDWSSDVCSSDLVVPVDREQVVNADEGGIVGAHLFRHRLAPQPLLQRVETRCLTALHASAHEQFAVDHRFLVEGRNHFGKGGADLLAAAAVETRLAAAPFTTTNDLDPNSVPYPFRVIVDQVYTTSFTWNYQHAGATN